MAQADVTKMPPRRWGVLLALALTYTLLNAGKPLTMDDAAYHQFAVQAAKAPLDPYGFELFWYQKPLPGPECYTPPVFPFWWSFALRLFGDQPVLWKLWLLPFGLMLTFALHSLFRRFARGLELPLTLMTVLSPAFLPSLNLMLDVPCVALSLTSLALFLRAAAPDSAVGWPAPVPNSLGLAALAGLSAGLAVETKYSGFLAVAALGLAATVFWRPVLGTVGLVCAGAVVGLCEGLIALRYGGSLLQLGLETRDFLMANLFTRFEQLWALLCILGAVAPALFLLGWAGLGGRRWAIAAGGGALLLALAWLAGFTGIFLFQGTRQLGPQGAIEYVVATFMLGEPLFLPIGLAGLGIILGAAFRLCRLGRGPEVWRRHPDDWFLLLWIGLEVAGYFIIAPVPGVRRVLVMLVAGTALLGRLASRTCRARPRRRLVQGITAYSVILGLGYFLVDWYEARAQQEGPAAAAAYIHEQREEPTIWYTGHWGFQYYAERLGMKPVIPEVSLLARGDWLVVPEASFEQQAIELTEVPLRKLDELFVGLDPVPYRTVVGYYLGYTPLAGRFGPRLTVHVYRVLADFTATALPDDTPSADPE